MHHTGLRGATFAAAIAVSLSACAVPHNNVLVFGTDTSFGVGVSIAPDPSSPVGINIGYKRKEAVWMPLVVNRQRCTTTGAVGGKPAVKTCSSTTVTDATDLNNPKVDPSAFFMGRSGGVEASRGGSAYEEDTYSVFASFGGNAKGGKEGAQLAVAQFFATGIAAQRLGANPAAAQLVSVQSPGTEAINQANKRADDNAQMLKGLTGLTDEEIAKAREEGIKQATTKQQRKEEIVAHVSATETDWSETVEKRLSDLIDKVEPTFAGDKLSFDNSKDELLKAKSWADFKSALNAAPHNMIEALAKGLKSS